MNTKLSEDKKDKDKPCTKAEIRLSEGKQWN